MREFAKNITTISAHSCDTTIPLTKTDKHSWQLTLPQNVTSRHVTVSYQVYAWDLSVRTAHLDSSHGFFNGTSTFLAIVGRENETLEVVINTPPNLSTWSVATGLTRQFEWQGNELPKFVNQSLRFSALCYEELIDHPVEMGELEYIRFEAAGVSHYIAITGAWPDIDLERLCKDLAPICEYQIQFFEPDTHKAPFKEYWFLIHATDNGYGGLEHRNSTALICGRKDLPYRGMKESNADYRTFLGLCSHEYFHAWNVKRIKPAALTDINLYQENYTSLLWIFEGFTSYYDDLALVRSKVISVEHYLECLSKTVSGVLKTPGRLVQSVAESSFDAWTKYYRQDENAINSITSYYTKGSLVALCLDAYIRKLTANKRSLDDVMRTLWVEFGKCSKGLGENAFSNVVKLSTGIDLSHVINRFTYTTDELPLKEVFEWLGHTLTPVKPTSPVDAGITTYGSGSEVVIKTVRNGSSAHYAGLSAGDSLVAIDGYKATEEHWKRICERKHAGDTSEILVFRKDKLLALLIRWQANTPTEWKIEKQTGSDTNAVAKAPWLS